MAKSAKKFPASKTVTPAAAGAIDIGISAKHRKPLPRASTACWLIPSRCT